MAQAVGPSEKPLGERLQLKGGRTLAVLLSPETLHARLDGLAPPAALDQADVILAFAADRAQLIHLLQSLPSEVKGEAIVWVAYPKLTSALRSDLSRDLIHGLAMDHGLTTVAQIAIDQDWSAMRLKRIAGRGREPV